MSNGKSVLFHFLQYWLSILWWRLSELHAVHKLTVLGQQSPASSPPPLLPGIDENPCELCWDRGALRRGDVMSILSIAVPDLYERDQGEQSHSWRADIREDSWSFSINPHIYWASALCRALCQSFGDTWTLKEHLVSSWVGKDSWFPWTEIQLCSLGYKEKFILKA